MIHLSDIRAFIHGAAVILLFMGAVALWPVYPPMAVWLALGAFAMAAIITYEA